MPIKSIQIGQTGVSNRTPSWVYIETNDTIAAVTTAGYLNGAASEYVNSLQRNMMALVATKTSPGIGTAPVLYILQLQNNSGVWSLVAPAVDVPVPFIVLGDIQAGASGTAGKFISFPGTASKGSLIFKAVANTGNTNTTVSNAAMGQASVISIPDPAGATADFVLAPAALVNNNLVKASGTVGLVADAGIAASAVMQTTAVNTMSGSGQIILVKANGTEAANAVTASGNAGLITTSSLSTAGGSSYAITWTNTLITSTSSVVVTLAGGTNTTENITIKVAPDSGTATMTIYNNTAATALNGTILISYVVL
jgi:hypothetical protein